MVGLEENKRHLITESWEILGLGENKMMWVRLFGHKRVKCIWFGRVEWLCLFYCKAIFTCLRVYILHLVFSFYCECFILLDFFILYLLLFCGWVSNCLILMNSYHYEEVNLNKGFLWRNIHSLNQLYYW